jgi:hypothetical protein
VAQPHKIPRLFLEKSNLDIGTDFQGVGKAPPRALGSLGDSFDFAKIQCVKSDDQVRFTIRCRAENDGWAFVKRHSDEMKFFDSSYQKGSPGGRNPFLYIFTAETAESAEIPQVRSGRHAVGNTNFNSAFSACSAVNHLAFLLQENDDDLL